MSELNDCVTRVVRINDRAFARHYTGLKSARVYMPQHAIYRPVRRSPRLMRHVTPLGQHARDVIWRASRGATLNQGGLNKGQLLSILAKAHLYGLIQSDRIFTTHSHTSHELRTIVNQNYVRVCLSVQPPP